MAVAELPDDVDALKAMVVAMAEQKACWRRAPVISKRRTRRLMSGLRR